VDPVLKKHPRSRTYKRGSWGPKQADAILAPDVVWQNPRVTKSASHLLRVAPVSPEPKGRNASP